VAEPIKFHPKQPPSPAEHLWTLCHDDMAAIWLGLAANGFARCLLSHRQRFAIITEFIITNSQPLLNSSIPRRCCMMMSLMKARCGAANVLPISFGEMPPLSLSETFSLRALLILWLRPDRWKHWVFYPKPLAL